MCNDLTERDAREWRRARGLTRRDFSSGMSAAAILAMLPVSARALEVLGSEVTINTPDGSANCWYVAPAEGSHAAVIMWPDIFGLREAFRAMGQRLAESGYAVLVPNPYYRTIKEQPVPDGARFGDEGVRDVLMPLARSLSPATCVTDGRAFVQWLDSQPGVDSSRNVGTAGYCMTGSFTMRLAAAMPNRIGAGASFHGGGLADQSDDSPHLLIPDMKADFLIAIAENDDDSDPQAKHLLREAFAAAGLDAEIEVYEGTRHGWCPLDSQVYDQAQAERAWNRMLALFDRELA